VARESSQVHNVAWASSQVHNVARAYSVVTCLNACASLVLHGFAVGILPVGLRVKITKSKTAHVQRFKPLADNFFTRHDLPEKAKKYSLFKRVSSEFKTQEKTHNETLWLPGTTVEHKAWAPENDECGAGKFHAVARPYFGDEFRSNLEDRYIAIEIAAKDLYEWKNPQYPHKIAFRKGTVLYECDKYGNKV